MKKHNGFNQKLNPYQITSYICIFTLFGTYFLLLMPLSSDISKIIGGTFQTILSIVVLVSGYLATEIDPSDSIVKRMKQAALSNTPFDIPVQQFYCPMENSYILQNSKHCKKCDRCTEEFDHHCIWINNDVGKANYKHFFALISSLSTFLIMYLACGIALTVDYAKDSYLIENNIYLYSNNPGEILAVMILLWILMITSGVGLFMAGNLVLLHIYLITKGMTTYEYITGGNARRPKNAEESIKNGIDHSKRTYLDFILCLKKRKKVALERVFTMNGNAQKSVNKELNNNSEDKTRKMSNFLKNDEVKAPLDNTQNEENIRSALASPRTNTAASPDLSNEVNLINKERMLNFEGNLDTSKRILISKRVTQIEILKTSQTNRVYEEGISPKRKDQEPVHEAQTTKMQAREILSQ